MSINPSFGNEGTFVPDNLFAGSARVVTDSVVIAAGQQLVRGAVLGRISSTGQYVLSEADATDGSEVPTAILAQDVDTTGGARTVTVYVAGMFNARRLVLGNGHTVASVKDALRDVGIYIRVSSRAWRLAGWANPPGPQPS